MARLKDPVRIRDAEGREFTHERAYATSHGLEIVKDARAVDRAGRTLSGSTQLPEALVAASVDAQADLKGKALNDALKAAGLPAGGTAAEKRARYAEHLAAAANLPPEGGVEDTGTSPDVPADNSEGEVS